MGFALGVMAGCILGATQYPVDKAILAMTAADPLKPLMEDIRTVGILGLGTLIGATALSMVMTTVVAGVILAAMVTSAFVSTRSCGTSHTDTFCLWALAGLAGAFGTSLSGATLGVIIEWIVKNHGMMGLLSVLSIFTVLKPPLNLMFKVVWKQGEACCNLVSVDWAAEHIEMLQQRQVQIEQENLLLEKGRRSTSDTESTWFTERRQREEMEWLKMHNKEAEMEQKNIQDWINIVVVKHVDFLAFSGIPMTVITMVTSGFGLFGYGSHRFVFIILLALVAVITYILMKSSQFKFWMLIGCMGMFVTFIIATLTFQAGQAVLTGAMMKGAGQNQSRESISAQMNKQSCLEALNASFFAAKLCELCLGAIVGGLLVRRAAGEAKVIIGAAIAAMGLLGVILVLNPVLGDGGNAGALLGVVGAVGMSVGAATAMAVRWSSWQGTLGTIAGLVIGALGVGRWHPVNIGLQLSVVYMFAMTNPF